jgi:hypothetical protein
MQRPHGACGSVSAVGRYPPSVSVRDVAALAAASQRSRYVSSGSDDHTLLVAGQMMTGLTLLPVQYQAQKTSQIRPGLKVHELKADDRAVCGNPRRGLLDDRAPER